MIFRPYYLGCLSHGSYLIADGGEAAVVDPQRDVDQYIEDAKELGVKIRYVVETHLHADFVSGHRELADRTGATILIGSKAEAEFDHHAVVEGETFEVGSITLEAIETPGHTPEGISWLVSSPDESEPDRLLTGDTLFIGDVGRPDLAGGRGFTAEQMAGMLYDSLHQKILRLPDDTEVWPAHGAGSACGRNISSERSSTVGVQRHTNWALQIEDRDEFIRLMTEDLPEAPAYFSMDAEINRKGARALAEVTAPRIDADTFEQEIARQESVVLDVRSETKFGEGHIPGSLNIGLRGQYASWAGSLLTPESSVWIVADDDAAKADEAIMRLARVGLENVAGVLEGGFDGWRDAGKSVAQLEQRSVVELNSSLGEEEGLLVLDVRRPGEYVGGHVPGAMHIPLSQLQSRMGELDRTASISVICEGGYRSSAAASLLLRTGFDRVRNVAGGTSAWRQAGFATETGREAGAA